MPLSVVRLRRRSTIDVSVSCSVCSRYHREFSRTQRTFLFLILVHLFVFYRRLFCFLGLVPSLPPFTFPTLSGCPFFEQAYPSSRFTQILRLFLCTVRSGIHLLFLAPLLISLVRIVPFRCEALPLLLNPALRVMHVRLARAVAEFFCRSTFPSFRSRFSFRSLTRVADPSSCSSK